MAAALSEPTSLRFSESEVAQFRAQGFVIARALTAPAVCAEMVRVTKDHVDRGIAPIEYEADVHYPGAPASRAAPGGNTARRLLQAYARHEMFRRWAVDPMVTQRVRQLLAQSVVLPQAHHNCIMTKQPRYSSDTLWHQDIRYWSFERPELITVWLALGRETAENGCLYLLPGTHTMTFGRERLDQALSLREDFPENRRLIQTKLAAELSTGDVLFFHCRNFHGAGRNHTDQTKFSLVFTFRPADNLPLLGTRSAQSPEIELR